MELNMEQQKLIMELQSLEQKMKQDEAQIEAVHRQLAEMQEIINSIEVLKKGETETLLPIGKGIFVKNKTSIKTLFINIGSGIILEKTIEEAIKLLNDQMKKLENMLENYSENLSVSGNKIQELISNLYK